MLSVSKKPEKIAHLENIKYHIELKSRLISYIRDYFNQNDFIEVFTPTIISAPAPEEYIEAFNCGSRYLRTSPELEMKQMLVAGYDKIVQIGPCYREGELGRLHNPEFLMLEWYQVGVDYNFLITFTQGLLQYLASKLLKNMSCEVRNSQSLTTIDFSKDIEKITVHQAFAKFAEISPELAIKNDSFDEILIDKIEPNLGLNQPTIMMDYPYQLAAFSKLKDDNKLCERWELYLGGLEIANAYSELINPKEQETRFAKFAETRKKTKYKKYPYPTEFMQSLYYGMPESAGCALGIDRLAMIFANVNNIKEVLF